MFFEMTYDQAITFLDGRIGAGWKLGLDSIRRFLAEIGDPHQKIKCVHIAGTNGKGSTAAMLEAIFRSAGYRTGLYTSPHLLDVRERMQVNRTPIPRDDFARLMLRLAPHVEKYGATYFETVTALAFLYFAESNLDLLFLEVGLGGRLDATNVVVPALSIITNIDYDHTKHLGDTIAKIAGEKAGIVKPRIPCLIGDLPKEAQAVVTAVCQSEDATLFRASDLYKLSLKNEASGKTFFQSTGGRFAGEAVLGMNGVHQLSNAGVAMAASDLLSRMGCSVERKHVKEGLANVHWPGRFQIIDRRPQVVLDVAHNPASVGAFVRSLRKLFPARELYFIIGLMQDKDTGQIVSQIAEVATAVQPVAPDSARALSAHDLHRKFARYDIKLYQARSVAAGVANVLRNCGDNAVVCITGSHYIVGDALQVIKGLTK